MSTNFNVFKCLNIDGVNIYPVPCLTGDPFADYPNVEDGMLCLTSAGSLFKRANGEWLPETERIRGLSNGSGDGAICLGPISELEESPINIASGDASLAQGEGNKAYGNYSIAQGYNNTVELTGVAAFASGGYNRASGSFSQALGAVSLSKGNQSIAAGTCSTALGLNSVALGNFARAIANNSIALGAGVTAGQKSFALGGVDLRVKSIESYLRHGRAGETINEGEDFVLESYDVSQLNSIIEPYLRKLIPVTYKLLMPYGDSTISLAVSAIDLTLQENTDNIETLRFTVRPAQQIVLPEDSEIENAYAFVFSSGTLSQSSLALGGFGHTFANYSQAQGYGIIADQNYQLCCGKYNKTDMVNSLFVVGNGTSKSPIQEMSLRSNAFVVDVYGNATYSGAAQSTSGADYAEYFEWEDGNVFDEDRVGLVVTLKKNKIALANADDEVLGIISGTAAIIGDAASWDWQDKYQVDDFGRAIWLEGTAEPAKQEEQLDVELDDEEQVTESSQKLHTEKGVMYRPINPAYDASKSYVPRSQRREWDAVGIIGKLHVRDDNTCQPGEYAKVGENGILTHSENKTSIRVMERKKDNIVLVFIK